MTAPQHSINTIYHVQDWMYWRRYAVKDFNMNIYVKIRNPHFLVMNGDSAKTCKSGIMHHPTL
jgi:hypothetical protein